VLVGSRVSLQLGLISVTLGARAGIALGLIAGYHGGWIDVIVSRFIDALLAFPSILLALVVIAASAPTAQRDDRRSASPPCRNTRGWCAAACWRSRRCPTSRRRA
jgi:ABC-type dipeptide/oligopeptide/nickel transport system permease subunit